jgi:hypothetical protein
MCSLISSARIFQQAEAILGQVPPTLMLSFVVENGAKAGVGRRFLSENLLRKKLGEERCPSGKMISS